MLSEEHISDGCHTSIVMIRNNTFQRKIYDTNLRITGSLTPIDI